MSRRLLYAASAMALVVGCTTFDRAVGLVPWFTTMRDQIAIRPFEAPQRTPPRGSVPTWGREDSLDLFGSDLRNVINPVPREDASLVRGRAIYNTYCTVCHGATGAGDGPVAQKLLGMVPPLIGGTAMTRTDGYLYAIIRHGRGAMPRYGDKILGRDRWHVVNYVRTLQGQ